MGCPVYIQYVRYGVVNLVLNLVCDVAENSESIREIYVGTRDTGNFWDSDVFLHVLFFDDHNLFSSIIIPQT